MTSLRYHSCYVCVRVPLSQGYGYLADRLAFQGMCAIGSSAPCAHFLVDAGDISAELAHQAAKLSQQKDGYARGRLASPRFTHRAEHQQLIRKPPPGQEESAFLELVLAGDDELIRWSGEAGEELPAKPRIAIEPSGVHCHTPLNQRLLPGHMAICQFLVEFVASRVRLDVAATMPAALLAAVGTAGVLQRLGLRRGRHLELARFGQRYLAEYMELPGFRSEPAINRRRAQQIDAVLHGSMPMANPASSGTLASALRSEGVLFPESVWMQLHWFTSSLGVAPLQEIMILEAIEEWALLTRS